MQLTSVVCNYVANNDVVSQISSQNDYDIVHCYTVTQLCPYCTVWSNRHLKCTV